MHGSHTIKDVEHFETEGGKWSPLPGVLPAIELAGGKHTRVLMLDENGTPYTVTLDGTWTMAQLTGWTDVGPTEGGVTLALPLAAGEYSAVVSEIRPARRRKTTRRRRRPRVRTAEDREHSAEVREWAKEQGYPVADRGRLPAPVKLAYDQAHTG